MKQSESNDHKIDEALQRLQVPFTEEDKARARQRVMNRIDQAEIVSMHSGRQFSILLKVAASLLLLIGAFALIYALSGVRATNENGDYLAVKLPDGSEVTLAPQSSVRYNRLAWHFERELTLEGEAFFEVVEGGTFTVRAPLGEVEVKGTSFSVWARKSRFLVHCLSGKVEARMDSDTVTLGAGMLASAEGPTAAWRLTDMANNPPLLPQNSSTLKFENTPLEVVCAELEKVFGVVVQNDLNPELRYTGQLSRYRKDESFRVLCTTFGARMVESEGRITLKP